MIPAAQTGEHRNVAFNVCGVPVRLARQRPAKLKSGRETSKAYPIPRHYGDPWNILLALYKRMKARPHIG